MKHGKLCAAVAAALAATCAWGAQQETPSTLKDQQSVAVTIYNENLALIKDARRRRAGRRASTAWRCAR